MTRNDNIKIAEKAFSRIKDTYKHDLTCSILSLVFDIVLIISLIILGCSNALSIFILAYLICLSIYIVVRIKFNHLALIAIRNCINEIDYIISSDDNCFTLRIPNTNVIIEGVSLDE